MANEFRTGNGGSNDFVAAIAATLDSISATTIGRWIR